MPRDLKLPSGRTLHIQEADFKTAKALYKAVAAELLELKVTASTDVNLGLMKDIICKAVSSERVEAQLWECFKVVTIDGVRILNEELFEPLEARDDWFTVCLEVARDNVLPFMKSLMPQFLVIVERAKASLKSEL